MIGDISILPVVTVALLTVAVGSMWYSPMLFGEMWFESLRLSYTTAVVPSVKRVVQMVIVGFLLSLGVFWVVAYLIQVCVHAQVPLAAIGYAVWVGMIGVFAGLVFFERQSLKYFCAHAGFMTLIYSGGIGVLYYWPW